MGQKISQLTDGVTAQGNDLVRVARFSGGQYIDRSLTLGDIGGLVSNVTVTGGNTLRFADFEDGTNTVGTGTPRTLSSLGYTDGSAATQFPLTAAAWGRITADGVETMIDYLRLPDPEKKAEKLAVDSVLAITKNLTSKTFLEGITGFLQAVHDPERYGGSYLNSFASVLVPGAVAQFARGADPVMREINSFSDALQNRLPGLRTTLPVKYDIVGEARENPAYGLMGTFGLATKEATQTPLQKAIDDVGFTYTRPEKKIRGVELDATTYERYSKLSGQMINELLTPIVESPEFNNYTKEQKRFIMKRVAERGRLAATNIMFGEKMSSDPEFATEFRRQVLKKRGVRATEEDLED